MKKITALFITIVAAAITFALFPKEINAQAVVYQDNFEQDSVGTFPSNWIITRNLQWNNLSLPCMNGNSPAVWRVENAFGSKRVGIAINGFSCITEIIPSEFSITDPSNYQF